MKVLFVDDDPAMGDIYSMIMEAYFPTIKFEIVDDGMNGKLALEQYDDIVLIVSDFQMPNLSGVELFKLNQKYGNVPFVMISGDDITSEDWYSDFVDAHEDNYFIQKPFRFNDITDYLARFFAKKSQLDSHLKGFKEISVEYLQKYFAGHQDLYLEVGIDNYVKVFTNGDRYEKETLDRYISRGETRLFLSQEDFGSFIEAIFKSLSEKKLPSSLEQALDAVSLCQKNLKLSEKEIHYLDSVAGNIYEELMKDSKTAEKIKEFSSFKDYYYDHSIMSLYAAYSILKELHRNEVGIVKKVAYAIFIHDIFLEKRSLSEIRAKDFHFDELSAKDQEVVLKHPEKASEYMKSLPMLSSDIAQMILHHHEHPSGNGFPRGLKDHNLNFLSALFILSLEVSHLLYQRPKDIEGVKGMLHEFDSFENFSKLSKSLLSVLS